MCEPLPLGRFCAPYPKAVTNQHAAALNDRLDSLWKTMSKPQNERWTGAMAGISCPGADLSGSGLPMFDGAAALAEGEYPWLVVTKKAAFRWGPNAWLVPGVGCWVNQASTCNGVLLAVRVGDFVRKGLVVLPDAPAFMETEAGAAMLPDTLTIVDLRGTKKLAWIPFGYMVSPLVMPDADDDDAPRPSGSSTSGGVQKEDLGFFYVLPAFINELCAPVSDAHWQPILNMNEDYFKKMGDSALWTARKAAFDALHASRTT